MRSFWYFVAYSFLGFLLEVAFAQVTRAKKRDRKCFWLLPLCPVYGLGAQVIVNLPRSVLEQPLLLILWGGAAATGVEYLTAVFYEKGLGVSFWDYSGLPGNRKGRVCPQFAVIWGVLAAVLVYRVHPVVSAAVETVPAAVTAAAMVLIAADGLCTAVLLRRTRSTASLRWYDNKATPAAE